MLIYVYLYENVDDDPSNSCNHEEENEEMMRMIMFINFVLVVFKIKITYFVEVYGLKCQLQ